MAREFMQLVVLMLGAVATGWPGRQRQGGDDQAKKRTAPVEGLARTILNKTDALAGGFCRRDKSRAGEGGVLESETNRL